MKTNKSEYRIYHSVKRSTGLNDRDLCVHLFIAAQSILANTPKADWPPIETKMAALLTAGLLAENAYRHLRRASGYKTDHAVCLGLVRLNQRLYRRLFSEDSEARKPLPRLAA